MLIAAIVVFLLLLALAVGLLARTAFSVKPSAATEAERRRLAWQRFQADRQIDGVVHQAFSDLLEEGRRQRGRRP